MTPRSTMDENQNSVGGLNDFLDSLEGDMDEQSVILTGKEPINLHLRHGQKQRLLEEVNYWRQRAGWFDDDASMEKYNAGVYDSYYSIDDDNPNSNSGSSSSIMGGGGGGGMGNVASAIFKVSLGLVALVMLVLFIRAIRRRVGPSSSSKKRSSSSRSSDKRDDTSRAHSRHRSGSRSRSSRSRSKSGDRVRRSRSSRSRSRARRGADGDAKDYALMSDEDGRHKSSRSKSRDKSRTRSRSRARREGRSSSRGDHHKEEAMLV